MKKKIYVNMGCGVNIVPSTRDIKWINIDHFIGTKHPDFREGDIMDIPLERESVDYLILDQVLEHIRMQDIPGALQEVKRVLKKGGRCIIVVPDFKGAIQQWLRIDHDKCFNPHIYHYLSEVIYGNQVHDGEYHKTAMSPGLLHYSLNMVGLPKHEIVIHSENAPVAVYPGMPEGYKTAFLRNAQIVCDIYRQ